jgi:epoxyqueuosine reductase
MIDANLIKEIAFEYGADLCGIATIERFKQAPKGFSPIDIYPETKSVVVIAKKLLEGIFLSNNPIPYTVTSDVIRHEIIQMVINICIRLEQEDDVIAVPVPSQPYHYWDEENRRGQGILSLRHAGYLAGLGIFGKNTLLTNNKFGNRIRLGALLTNVQVEPDKLADYEFCSDNCKICITNCPAGAINGKSVNQKLCRPVSQGHTTKGDELYLCNNCIKLCPNGKGFDTKQPFMKI